MFKRWGLWVAKKRAEREVLCAAKDWAERPLVQGDHGVELEIAVDRLLDAEDRLAGNPL